MLGARPVRLYDLVQHSVWLFLPLRSSLAFWLKCVPGRCRRWSRELLLERSSHQVNEEANKSVGREVNAFDHGERTGSICPMNSSRSERVAREFTVPKLYPSSGNAAFFAKNRDRLRETDNRKKNTQQINFSAACEIARQKTCRTSRLSFTDDGSPSANSPGTDGRRPPKVTALLRIGRASHWPLCALPRSALRSASS